MNLPRMRPAARWGVVAMAVLTGVLHGEARAQGSFVTFESGQVRPLALSPDGSRLFAVNTPDNRLEIFTVSAGTLTHTGSVPVGLEPVAVAARTDGEVWVVNLLSDSVSIVDVAASPPRVIRTLLVGDEPRDIVFGGPGGVRAFITTARRGQNVPVSVPPLLTTAGTPRALVWAFDATNLGISLAGDPLSIIQLFGDTPRALAVSPDGSTVYAAVFHSGNQTTPVHEGAVCDDGNLNNNAVPGPCNIFGVTMPGGLPLPEKNVQGLPRPEVGLIVKFDNGLAQWRDELGRNWNNAVKFSLPDKDVFAIDANANPPAAVAGPAGFYPHVGTVLFNMVVNPFSGKLYVSNTEAINEVRFEGPGILSTTVNGHLHEARISVLDAGSVTPIHLNKHINYALMPSPLGTSDDSLATPVGMAVTSDGNTLYVAAFGSSKVGVFDTAALEGNTFTPNGSDYIAVSGGGPSGVVLDETNDRLYVLTRFDNSISVVNTLTKGELAHLPLYNPEPPEVVDGRPVLYDAVATSSNGEASCSSCHIFGDFDSLGWDLGNPDDLFANNPNPIKFNVAQDPDFHPMKGPMTTQSLRGMAGEGPMHWRGDRTEPTDPLNENEAFKKFIVAFAGLLGRDGAISNADMQKFADFILEVTYPPNPIRPLDNVLTGDALAGRNFYFGPLSDGIFNCNGCHVLSPIAGFFGSDGETTFENETQMFKVAHLRNVYQKVGMFGMPAIPFIDVGDNGFTGDQVRGFGILHDGSVDTVFRFVHATVFSVPDDTTRRQLEAFVHAYDSNLAPIVGQQTTLTDTNAATVGARISLFLSRAAANECDVIVKGTVAGQQRGYYRLPDGTFQSDRATDAALSDAQVRALAATPGHDLTYTAVPPGNGLRAGVDRDEDGYYDRDELDAGSDPADPLSVPGTFVNYPIVGKKLLVKDNTSNDEAKRKIVLISKSGSVVIPTLNGTDDPRCGLDPLGTVKATLRVASTAGQDHTTDLPCQNWELLGSPSSPRGFKYKDPDLTDSTVKTLVWKTGKLLKAVLQGRGPTTLDYDLQLGVPQGTVSAVLTSGLMRQCMGCLPSNGKNGSDGKQFLGKDPDCPAPVTCAGL